MPSDAARFAACRGIGAWCLSTPIYSVESRGFLQAGGNTVVCRLVVTKKDLACRNCCRLCKFCPSDSEINKQHDDYTWNVRYNNNPGSRMMVQKGRLITVTTAATTYIIMTHGTLTVIKVQGPEGWCRRID